MGQTDEFAASSLIVRQAANRDFKIIKALLKDLEGFYSINWKWYPCHGINHQ